MGGLSPIFGHYAVTMSLPVLASSSCCASFRAPFVV